MISTFGEGILGLTCWAGVRGRADMYGGRMDAIFVWQNAFVWQTEYGIAMGVAFGMCADLKHTTYHCALEQSIVSTAGDVSSAFVA